MNNANVLPKQQPGNLTSGKEKGRWLDGKRVPDSGPT